jgi:hypothetical protein
MSYIKTGDIENKISAASLNNWDCEKWGNCGQMVGDGSIFFAGFLECGSEKGSSRKYTGKRVTRWRMLFWGNLAFLR